MCLHLIPPMYLKNGKIHVKCMRYYIILNNLPKYQAIKSIPRWCSDLSESIEIKSPISDHEPVLHSSPIIDRGHSKKMKIKNLRTLILNCQSLRGKVEAFQSSVDYFQPDCILGTESWLDKSVSTNEMFPPGYKIFRRDRITSTQGGGVFIAAKENYDVSLLYFCILLSISWL